MKIYFLRHGRAIDDKNFFNDDHLRPLSPEGRQSIQSAAQFIAQNVSGVEFVFSSPFLRARQTMEIVRSYLHNKPEYAELDLIQPNNNDYKKLLGYLKSLECTSVLYAGHEPQIRGFIDYLISDSERVHLEIGVGSLHCVDFSDAEYVSPGSGKLVFSIPQDLQKAS